MTNWGDQFAPPPLPSPPTLGTYAGELVWVRFISLDPQQTLPWGVKDAVTIEWEVLTGPDVGAHHEMQLSNVMLVNQLREQPPGKVMFARVAAQGTGKGNPAIYLDPRPLSQADQQIVRQWLSAHQAQPAPGAPQPGGGAPAAPPGYQQTQQQPTAQQQPYSQPQQWNGQQQMPAPTAPPVNQGNYDPPPF